MKAKLELETATTEQEVKSHIAAWKQLEQRALEDNVYLSAAFLTTALKYFGRPYRLVFVYEKTDTSRELIAVAPFTLFPRTRLNPFKRLSTFHCFHMFLPYPLLDRIRAQAAVRALWDWLDDPRQPWGLILVEQIDKSGLTWKTIEAELNRRQRKYWVKRAFPQAMHINKTSFEHYQASLPRSIRRNYQRRWRKLNEAGQVEVLLHRNLDRDPDLAERFIELEQRSWKAKAEGSLLDVPENALFFKEITRVLAGLNQLFFVEVRLDQKTIAMNLSFIFGNTLFGYKTAFDEDYRKYSPGIVALMHETGFFYQTPGLKLAQSGTDIPGSYLEHYWRETAHMHGMTIPTRRLAARAYVALAPPLFRVLERFRRKRGKGDPVSAI